MNTWGCRRNSSLHIAQGWADSPWWTDLALTCVHSSSISLSAGEATKPIFWAETDTYTLFVWDFLTLKTSQSLAVICCLPNDKAGGAGSRTYSLSSLQSPGLCKPSTLPLARGFVAGFLLRLSKGSESEKSDCSRLRVMWSWKATEVITSLLLALDFKPCKRRYI